MRIPRIHQSFSLERRKSEVSKLLLPRHPLKPVLYGLKVKDSFHVLNAGKKSKGRDVDDV